MDCHSERSEESTWIHPSARAAGFFAAFRMTNWLLTALAIVVGARAADLRVVGTDLLGVEFSKALYAFAVGADLRLALALDGSRPGLDELKAGRADLGLFVFAPGEEAGAEGFERRTVAYHRVVVLAPSALPLDQLTLDQIDGIFGAGAPLRLSVWGDLGLGGAWAVSHIQPHVPAVGTGLAPEFFRHAVLHDRALKTGVVRYDRPADLASVLDGDSRAIAIAPVSPGSNVGAKLLAVAVRAGGPAFLPTLENLHSGDYPLRLPVAVFFRRGLSPSLLPLLRFLFSDEVAPHFERAELAPLPPAARRQQLLALEKP